eukprot:3940927-Rhodomonas_salina.1
MVGSATSLRTCYAMSGTDAASDGTAALRLCGSDRVSTQCPVLVYCSRACCGTVVWLQHNQHLAQTDGLATRCPMTQTDTRCGAGRRGGERAVATEGDGGRRRARRAEQDAAGGREGARSVGEEGEGGRGSGRGAQEGAWSERRRGCDAAG